MKGIHIGKEEVKKNPKDVTRKLLELIKKFGKVAGDKVNIQNSVAFLMKYQKENLKKQSHLPLHEKE